MLNRIYFMVILGLGVAPAAPLTGAELVELNEKNWDAYVPAGKEVDAIYGDHVLRSDRLVAVIARAVDSRNANMTVKRVGGSLIDLTQRHVQSDQLSCFYPHGGEYKLAGPVQWPAVLATSNGSAARLAFEATPRKSDNAAASEQLQLVVGYELADGVDYLTVRTLITNPTDKPIEIELSDALRADGEFKFGDEPKLNLWWCQDAFWRQAYGLQPVGNELMAHVSDPDDRRPIRVHYRPATGDGAIVIPPGESLTFSRRIFPAPDTLGIQAIARALRDEALAPVTLSIVDRMGPIQDATVRVYDGERRIGSGRTDSEGLIAFRLPPADYHLAVTAQGREKQEFEATISHDENRLEFELPTAGYVECKIVDGTGTGVPCKIVFMGQEGVRDPKFGPDSAVHGVRNLWYTDDGKCRVPLLPGKYETIVSHGPEYDAIHTSIDVVAGETTRLNATLVRTVDTTGWLSAEMHSHSSPSGDNTSSQRGRVLNLLAEHLEFIPCTEHQRVSTYEPDLKHFGARHRVLTCSGMELTGNPLPINHQNAFPLIMRERTQDGGGPVTDANPEVQIARLAMWDDKSDKVVQINHPNVTQMIGDRDLDGTPDDGFRKMFHFADVMEVHPLPLIFDELTKDDDGWKGRGKPIIHWMQLLNLGYRLPAVVNTDAHWNFHGSGWHRNYVRSSTDDPSAASLMEICHALERGQVVMTNGPFMSVEASSGEKVAGPGDDLEADPGDVSLHVHVECPNWLDVNRVQVFINGRPVESLNHTRRARGAMFGDGTVKFDSTIPLKLEGDAHVIVAAAGEGRQLGLVYGPSRGEAMPIAVNNPIFIDIDGNGFEPNGDTLGVPLPVEADHHPTHGHDHPHPHHHPHPHD